MVDVTIHNLRVGDLVLYEVCDGMSRIACVIKLYYPIGTDMWIRCPHCKQRVPGSEYTCRSCAMCLATSMALLRREDKQHGRLAEWIALTDLSYPLSYALVKEFKMDGEAWSSG